jgi:DNA-binding response OmpR family regulator
MPEVLIVDDDPDIRGMLAFTLGDRGFSVREAKDGAGALEELRARPPDCMVLDLMMPNIDGFTVLERMRDRGIAPATRVLILTCKLDENSFVRGWELGADEYLTKPADPDLIADKLRGLVDQASAHRR